MFTRKIYKNDEPDFFLQRGKSVLIGLALMALLVYLTGSLINGDYGAYKTLIICAIATLSLIFATIIIMLFANKFISFAVTFYCLFRYPLWMSTGKKVGTWAVKKIHNEEKLKKIILDKNTIDSVKSEAIKNLNSDKSIAEIALCVELPIGLRLEAADRIANKALAQKLYLNLALDAGQIKAISKAIVAKINISSLLEVAKNSNSYWASHYALDKISLEDEIGLEDKIKEVFYASPNINTKIYAASKLSQRSIIAPDLIQLAAKTKSPFNLYRLAKLINDEIMIEKAKNDLLSFLLHIEYASYDDLIDIKDGLSLSLVEMMDLLKDNELFLEVFIDSDNKVLKNSIAKLLDRKYLKELAFSDCDTKMAIAAAEILSNCGQLDKEELILYAKNSQVRKYLCKLHGHDFGYSGTLETCRCCFISCTHEWVTTGGCGTPACPRGGVEDWVLCGGTLCPGVSRSYCTKCGTHRW
ncbi:MAG: hypothetical protein LBE38_03630 [Deltaproteobacteria bacterium]|jgi:hypothetical protein|nr:hypothetical protein [Deltaproteobacteria bacterium]